MMIERTTKLLQQDSSRNKQLIAVENSHLFILEPC